MPFPSPKSLPGLQNIKDERVLAAMRKVDRAAFVPDDMIEHAYEDRALPIGHEQSISQPYIVALMSQLLELQGTEKVLEIGTGSGYQAAVLGELAKEVYSIEILPELAEAATQRLDALGYKTIHTRLGDGYQGWPENAPFDAIIVTCSPNHVPQPLIDQLSEGGRLAIPIGPWPKEQMLHRFRKTGGEIVKEPVIPVSFVPMTGELK
jgi:protein-L-isoaspartate(D-aspartate) O-methyltransferase